LHAAAFECQLVRVSWCVSVGACQLRDDASVRLTLIASAGGGRSRPARC
jgi:hypothetical protein